ncbi:MAG: AAA family ATPase [Woeseiaceae bacterium]|nr:AAA family ATPase [Woeseiaceae bacterium]
MAKRAANRRNELVGRSAEIDAIDRAIDALASGRGQVLMLSGEPGIGKSALARLAADRAAAASIPAYVGFAWEGGGAPAYWPWTQLLTSLVREQKPDAALTAGLGQLLPGGKRQPDDVALQPHQARFQLLETVRRLLEQISARTPLLLVLEDLHAADSDSLNLLHYIARHTVSVPVLVIGTFREIEARAMTAGAALWLACRDAEVLPLERLGESDIRDYLATRDEASFDEENIKALHSTTAGNPLFLSELVGLMSRQGEFAKQLPASVQQVIRQQIELLPEETSYLMATAAVLGREFSGSALGVIADHGKADIESLLGPALDTGLLRKTSRGSYRFIHGLHGDVLYQDMDPNRRSRLHLLYAKHLRTLIDEGDQDRWAELAEHLAAAGHEQRDEAIAAWRRAGKRAIERLAFEDAVDALQKALDAFGEGPRYEPADRYALLLECAEASLLTGATDRGFGYCRDAFEIAKAIGDARLMSNAALTWGSAIVVAKVDREFIAALEQCLSELGKDEVALRARVLARLAGALQPALDPSGPMDMAREAIEMARSCNDERVMYEVLRSAIAGLMDFAPADERLPLNEEFGALANEIGDVPGRFRSRIRLMIDACEVGDRGLMDSVIDECHQIAERIGLPHYRWRAASARAMQATLDGDFRRALSLLDEAQHYADEYGDVEAMVTLPLQHFAILIECDVDEVLTLEEIQARLDDAYAAGMSEARAFVTPFIASYDKAPDAARTMLANAQIVERTFLGGDRYSLCRLGEMAAAAGDTEIAARVYDALLPYADTCAMPGLMGSSCTGPTAWTLGIVAASLERYDDARAMLDTALRVAEAMRAPPWIARIHRSIADVARRTGHAELAAKHDAEADRLFKRLRMRPRREVTAGSQEHPPDVHSATIDIRRNGDVFEVSYAGEIATLRQSKGLEMLATLVARPDTDVHVLDLSGGAAVEGQAAAGPALDAQARSDYESRLADLREELEEAEGFGDAARADAARQEIDFITRELSRAFGLGGRARRPGADAERARVNVRRRLKDAILRVAEQSERAGRYLENTIKTGTYCRYTPM